MTANPDSDSFNLPASILGHHSEDFYSAVGRIVCVCAVLERQVTAMRHTLTLGAPQGEYTNDPVSKQIFKAYELSQELEPDAGDRVRRFLDQAKSAFERRNAIVHSSFPAQLDGTIQGYRSTRDKKVTDGRSDSVDTTLAELKDFIAELSRLCLSFNEVHNLCNFRK